MCNLFCHFFSAEQATWESRFNENSRLCTAFDRRSKRRRITCIFHFESEWTWEIALTLSSSSFFFIFPVHSARWKTYSKNLLYEYWGFIDGFHLVEWMFGETWKHSFRSIRRCIAIDLPIMETARRPVYSIINYLTRRLITNTYRPRNWIVPQSLALYCNAFAFRNSTSGIEVKIENFR